VDGYELAEVWCESHDDITLIWSNNGDFTVELVQVKAVDSASRWSPATLCYREGNKPGSSVLEQSMQRHQFPVTSKFRMVTFVDVSDDLSILKQPSNARQADKLSALKSNINGRLPNVTSPKGTGSDHWVDSCIWVKSDSESAIQDKNLHLLEAVLRRNGKELSPDHRFDLYQRLLMLVQKSSTDDLVMNPDAHIVTASRLRQYIFVHIGRMGYGGLTNVIEAVRNKMGRCGIPGDTIETAEELRIAYRTQLISARYFTDASLLAGEMAVTAILQELKAALDAGEIDESGTQFHSRCLQALSRVRQEWPDGLQMPSVDVLQGYMYERTGRCVHRFDRLPA